jgi:hypothetical protein
MKVNSLAPKLILAASLLTGILVVVAFLLDTGIPFFTQSRTTKDEAYTRMLESTIAILLQERESLAQLPSYQMPDNFTTAELMTLSPYHSEPAAPTLLDI